MGEDTKRRDCRCDASDVVEVAMTDENVVDLLIAELVEIELRHKLRKFCPWVKAGDRWL